MFGLCFQNNKKFLNTYNNVSLMYKIVSWPLFFYDRIDASTQISIRFSFLLKTSKPWAISIESAKRKV